jgi:TolA-binding protein
MRKLLIPAVLLGAAASVSVPASAQPYRGYQQNYVNDDRIDLRISEIRDRIRRAAAERRISRGEAERLLRQADQIDRLEDRYSRNGLTQWEVQDLRQRVQQLRQQLRFDRQDGPGYGYGDNYGPGYGNQYRDDDRIDMQIRQIEERIRWAAQQRRISGREAEALLRQARYIDELEDRYSRNGLTQWEVQDLRQRVRNLRMQLRFERQDGDNRRW